MHVIVLGSGLSTFSDGFVIQDQIPYQAFTQNRHPALEGHQRTIFLAEYQETPFIILSGKFHFYEGLPEGELVAPYQYIFQKYQIESITLTASSGALSATCQPGKWHQVQQVISLQPAAGLKFQTKPFSNLPKAVYAFQPGPSLGSRAEYFMLKKLGAGLVGMSLLPEGRFIQTQQVKMYGLSLPVCQYDPIETCVEPGHEEVIQYAQSGVHDLILLFSEFLKTRA